MDGLCVHYHKGTYKDGRTMCKNIYTEVSWMEGQ